MIRVATDVGGTFTDLVAIDDESGRVTTAKVLTTPDDPSRGVVAALARAGFDEGSLAAVGFMVHGGTTVINAIIERKGVRTAFVTTAGFRDVLAIGRGNRPDLYNLRARSPASFVPRHLCFEVQERMDATGRPREPLSDAGLEAVAGRLAGAGVEAVAIMFLHAYANPVHERAAAAYLRDRFPAMTVVASHEVSRRWREYERGTTAVLSAYVGPVMARYLAALEGALRSRRYPGPLYVMQSNAGLSTIADARSAPLALVESGPAGGVAGAAHAARMLGLRDVLHLDVGGTTAKCSLVLDGRPTLKDDYRLEWSRLDPGYPVQVAVVDIVEIGAGGGSIARIAEDGSLAVGPESAGADPGPACYGHGGTDPTVTDAKLICGVLDPRRFAGSVHLDRAAACKAFEAVAARMGGDVETAASAVIGVAEGKMINALKLVSVQRGHDPRDMALLVSGGAGPMHAAALGRDLGVARVVVPPLAGLFSAGGMLSSAPRMDLSRTLLRPADEAGFETARAILSELAAEAARRFGTETGARLSITERVEMRYRGQEHTVAVDLGPEIDDVARLISAFGAAHAKAYTFRLDGTAAELVTYHVSAEQPAPPVSPRRHDGPRSMAEARGPSRTIRTDEGRATAAVFDRDKLPCDVPFAGPALVEEPTATTLVLAGQTAHVDRLGFLVIVESRA